MEYTIHPIAHIRTDFTDKFGIPRQSGLVPELTARIVFEPEYRDPNALVGIEGYDRLWLIWQFSTVAAEYAAGKSWRPTVRPPRLGGNERRGVFATRSPYRPNALGLSCVELAGVENGELIVRGADAGRHADLRHQAVSALCGRLPRRPGRIYGHDKGIRFAGGLPRRAFVQSAGKQARRFVRCAEKRPPPRLPARPGAGVHAGFWLQ